MQSLYSRLHANMPACMRADTCAPFSISLCTNVSQSFSPSSIMCVICMQGEARTQIHTYHVRVYTHLHAHSHTCAHKHRCMNSHLHICTHTHTCMHTYMAQVYLGTYLGEDHKGLTVVAKRAKDWEGRERCECVHVCLCVCVSLSLAVTVMWNIIHTYKYVRLLA
jgi:hypothetical protein